MKDKLFLERKGDYVTIDLLNWDRMEEAIRLRQKIWDDIENKLMFAPAVREDFIKVLENGFGLVCLAHNKIIACLLCTLDDVEYGADCGYDEDTLNCCADYVDVFVDAEYRGNQLQNQLEEMMVHTCITNGKKIILGTVSPDNRYSYQNFITAGYREVGRMEKYGGLERILMEKRL